jgi:hypothetical protein
MLIALPTTCLQRVLRGATHPCPLTVKGNPLPTEFISAVEDIIGHLPTIGTDGYLGSE